MTRNESALSSTNFRLSSTNLPKTNFIPIYYFCSLDPFDRIEDANTANLLRTPFIFDSSDSSPFPIFPPPPPFSPFDHPLKKPTPDHVRITISSSPLLFGRERSCLPSHTIDVPFRRASDLFLPFSFFLPPLLSSYITIYIPHA